MTRDEFEKIVFDRFGTVADYPFEDDLVTGVLRHESGKWFCIMMNISAKKIGKSDEGNIDVVNLKCAPEVIESIAGVDKGVYRAYHMNKTHWLTLCLSECDIDTVIWLVDISYSLTKKKVQLKKKDRYEKA